MSPSGRPARLRAHSTHRLEALTDGVFAIVMTLLVLEIQVPHLRGGERLGTALAAVWPTFRAYVLSFIILGVYWFGQRSQYDYIKAVDRTLTWLNIFFLMVVALIPFSASLFGRYGDDPVAITIYGASLILVSACHAVIWWYATDPRRGLISDDCTSEIVALGRRLSLVPIFVYALAMVLAYVAHWLGHLVFAVVPFLYLFDVVRKFRLPAKAAEQDAFE
jgi:uncharacterized membrane protein